MNNVRRWDSRFKFNKPRSVLLTPIAFPVSSTKNLIVLTKSSGSKVAYLLGMDLWEAWLFAVPILVGYSDKGSSAACCRPQPLHEAECERHGFL